MPAPVNPNLGSLDQTQIMQRAFDETTDRLRTDAEVTGSFTGTIECEIDAASGDNIALANEDGSKKVTVTTVGAKEALDVNIAASEPLTIDTTGLATEAKQDDQILELQGINTNLILLDASVDAVKTSVDTVNTSVQAGNTILGDIETAINNLPQDNNGLISGTEDGTLSGTQHVFVNNIRLLILGAKDRVQNITYADFGTKDQRITQIDYLASSIGTGPGYTARKTLNYTPVSGKYRRDSIVWTIV